MWLTETYKINYSFSTKPYKHNKESAAHTSIVIPIGMPVCSPPIPTSGDTMPAANMLAKPVWQRRCLPFYRILVIAIEKEAEPNRDTVHAVKNKIVVTGMRDHFENHGY